MFNPELPAELALLILTYLPLSSIGNLRRVNREWSYFIKQNAATVYRNAAFQEGFIAQKQTLLSELDGTTVENEAGGSWGTRDGQGAVGVGVGVGSEHAQGLYSQKALRGVDSWESLCKRQKLIHRSWLGHASSRLISSPRVLPSPLSLNVPENSHYRRVHRIKVDEQVGITLATTELGGLVVKDIETDEVLWELPIWYVHSHAHLEYERGYIIFDRTDGGKEVWRRTQDVEADDAQRTSRRSSDSQPQGTTTTTPSTSAPSTTHPHDNDAASDGGKEDHDGQGEDKDTPRPKPDQRQLHVANYLHTLAVAFAAAAASPPSSAPSSHIDPSFSSASPLLSASSTPPALSPNPHPNPNPNPNYRTTKGHTSKAHFTPYTVLHLPAPEASRAFRFVFPHLLVAAVDRAYVFDVPRGRVVQVIEGVQRVRRVRVPEVEVEVEGEVEGGKGPLRNDTSDEGDDAARTPRPGSPVEGEGGSVRANNSPSNNEHSDQDENEEGEDEEDEEEDEDDPAAAQFLGQIRYVEISPRHVFIAGRHVLRVFSRETGKCVMNMSGAKERYGAWGWGVVGGGGGGSGSGSDGLQAAVSGVERDKGKQKQKASDEEPPAGAVDTYDAARVEGREAVRVPMRFTFQSEMRDGDHDRMVIDQFVAVHASRDGKHFVALLSGARLVVVHNFEALLDRHRVPRRSIRRHQPHQPNSPIRNYWGHRREKALDRIRDKAVQHAAQEARDRDLFMHTMDIRLGSPRVTASVYLAYEYGRIGVVTSTAVYIVTPTLPPPPAPLSSLCHEKSFSSSPPHITYPYPPPPPLRVTRLPYFVNPSWLGAVSCLMMSDTGLYLNWNPTAPVIGPANNRHGSGYASQHGPWAGGSAVGGGGTLHLGVANEYENENEGGDGDEMNDEDGWDGTVWIDEGVDWDEEDGDAEGEMHVEWGQHQLAGEAHQGGAGAGETGSHHLPTQAEVDIALRGAFDAIQQEECSPERDEEFRSLWEAEYQRDLRDMDACEDDWYQALPNGDMFVAANPRHIEISQVSTVFAVEFVPEL